MIRRNKSKQIITGEGRNPVKEYFNDTLPTAGTNKLLEASFEGSSSLTQQSEEYSGSKPKLSPMIQH
jgi:hypothetical protein